jgi:hypothetical protein
MQFSPLFFRISNFFGPSTTEEAWIVEMRIWYIKIGIVLVLRDEIARVGKIVCLFTVLCPAQARGDPG